jgi:flagellar biosynthesis anti-sigma factor FlgM
MTMRIDGNRLPTDAEQARRTEARQVAEREAAAGGVKGPNAAERGTDRVEMSPDRQLVATATQAALDSPAVRPAAVERARQALDNGTLGQDADRLADRILGSLLGD